MASQQPLTNVMKIDSTPPACYDKSLMLRIGTIEIESPFVQAALSGYSDLPMRTIAMRLGCRFAFNEVVLDKCVLYPGRKNKRDLAMSDELHPIGGQLMGHDPDVLAEAALLMVNTGYDLIDINFGCPVRKVLGRHRGGWMLGQPNRAIDIIRKVHAAVGHRVPVTVKLRRGLDDTCESEQNFFTIFDSAMQIGVAAVTVHPRTVKQRFTGTSDWLFLKKLREYAPDAVILGSGDLWTSEDCVRMLRETGVNGVTIARGCIGNPWIFRECEALWKGLPKPPPPTLAEQRSVIAEHYRLTCEFYGVERGSRIMRKHAIKYSQHHPIPKQARMAFVGVKTPQDWQHAFDIFYGGDVSTTEGTTQSVRSDEYGSASPASQHNP